MAASFSKWENQIARFVVEQMRAGKFENTRALQELKLQGIVCLFSKKSKTDTIVHMDVAKSNKIVEDNIFGLLTEADRRNNNELKQQWFLQADYDLNKLKTSLKKTVEDNFLEGLFKSNVLIKARLPNEKDVENKLAIDYISAA